VSAGCEVTFDVFGDPQPQGSKKAFVVNGKARMVEDAGKAGANWRDAVAQAALVERGRIGRPLDGALYLDVIFRFRMPRSRTKAIRLAGIVAKTTTPDLSKLVRSLEDGLQAVRLIADDARIHDLRARKLEVLDEWTGAHVRVGESAAATVPRPSQAALL
jgi:Holliday junction resolvase RusA-like endonuclease